MATDAEPTRRPGVRTIPGHQAIVDYLRREISLGRIMSGDRLPAERRLAEEFGVARETLRQALRVLEGEGQIVIRRGASGGAIVQSQAIHPAVMLAELRARRDEIVGLIEFRSVIEPGAAALAAQYRTDTDLEVMTAAEGQLLAATSRDESRSADTAFHLAIARASGNPLLERAIEDARAQMFSVTDLLSFEFIKTTSHDAHTRVLAAIQAQDARAASEAMIAHIATTADDFETLLTEGELTEPKRRSNPATRTKESP